MVYSISTGEFYAMRRLRRIFPLIFSLLFSSSFCFAGPLSLPPNIPRQPGNAHLETVLRDIAGQKAEIIVIQRELVSRPAIGPEAGGNGEEDKANWLTGFLHERGIPNVERLDSVDRTQSVDLNARTRDVRPNILVFHPGKLGMEKGRTLWIVCHLHVAAPGPLEMWNGSPWKLRVEGDTLYGRGVMDNYQSMTAAILLLEALTKNRLTPPLNLGVVLHSQNSGFRHVLDSRPELFKPGDLYLVPDYGNPQGSAVGVAEKGILWLKITVSSGQRHAANGKPASTPLVAGSHFVTMLPDFSGDFASADPLFPDPLSSFTPTQAFTSPSGINSVAASYAVYLDCRFIPRYSPDEIEQGVRRLAAALGQEHGVTVTVERLLASPSYPPSSMDSPLGLALQRAVKEQIPSIGGLKPEGVNVTTAASMLRARGISTLTWGKMNPANRQIANEFAGISDHIDEAGVFARILFDREIDPAADEVIPAAQKEQ
jgi:succinyl-diaminopimelate desuccinylase